MNSALSEIRRMPETKEQKDSFVNAVISELLAGEIDPVELEWRLKIIEDAITGIRKDVRVKNIVIEEIEKHNGLYKSGNIEIKVSSRRTFDFSNDPVFVECRAKLKARETLLKQMKCIPETGEALIEKTSEFLIIKY